MSWPAITPSISRVPVPELPKSSAVVRLAQAADAAPLDAPLLARALNSRSKRFQRLPRVDHVLGLEQAAHARHPRGKRAEDEGAVRDRLVARHAHAAG